MISNFNIPAQLPARELQAHLASSAKSPAQPISKNLADATPVTEPNAGERTSRVLRAEVSALTNKNLMAPLPPIEGKDQAAEATQHTRALIQAQPRAAMLAQANSSSQSVQRLLQ